MRDSDKKAFPVKVQSIQTQAGQILKQIENREAKKRLDREAAEKEQVADLATPPREVLLRNNLFSHCNGHDIFSVPVLSFLCLAATHNIQYQTRDFQMPQLLVW
jgi:hypothetical protein